MTKTKQNKFSSPLTTVQVELFRLPDSFFRGHKGCTRSVSCRRVDPVPPFLSSGQSVGPHEIDESSENVKGTFESPHCLGLARMHSEPRQARIVSVLPELQ